MNFNRKVKKLDEKLHITIFGPTCAGKTIFMSWIQGKPRLSNGSTVGSYIYQTQFNLNSKTQINTCFWDHPGHLKYMNCNFASIKIQDGVILMINVDERYQVESLYQYIERIQQFPVRQNVILVGNTFNSDRERQISNEELESIAQKYNYQFIECNTQTGENIQNILQIVVENAYKQKILRQFSDHDLQNKQQQIHSVEIEYEKQK